MNEAKRAMQATATGREEIAAAFAVAKQRGRSAALMPYYTLGYPDRTTSLNIIAAIAPDSDLLELGVPFSDPLADGPTIQHSTQVSLEQGTTLDDCLEMVRELRHRGVHTPILLFGYYNPFLAYGLERLASAARVAGAQGFIIPDLPPEEAKAIPTVCGSLEQALAALDADRAFLTVGGVMADALIRSAVGQPTSDRPSRWPRRHS